METAIDVAHLHRVFCPGRLGERVAQAAHFGNILRVAPDRAPAVDRALGQFQHFEHLGDVGEFDGGDPGALVGQERDQAFRRKPDQRLAHRRAGHTELLLELGLADVDARRQGELKNMLAHRLVDTLRSRALRPPDTRLGRCLAQSRSPNV